MERLLLLLLMKCGIPVVFHAQNYYFVNETQ